MGGGASRRVHPDSDPVDDLANQANNMTLGEAESRARMEAEMILRERINRFESLPPEIIDIIARESGMDIRERERGTVDLLRRLGLPTTQTQNMYNMMYATRVRTVNRILNGRPQMGYD